MNLFDKLPANPTRNDIEKALAEWNTPLNQMEQSELSRQYEILRPFAEELEMRPKESLSKNDEWLLNEFHQRGYQGWQNDAALCSGLAQAFLLSWPESDKVAWEEAEQDYCNNPDVFEDVTSYDEQNRPYYQSTKSSDYRLFFPEVLFCSNDQVNEEICTLNAPFHELAVEAYSNLTEEHVLYLPTVHKFVKRK